MVIDGAWATVFYLHIVVWALEGLGRARASTLVRREPSALVVAQARSDPASPLREKFESVLDGESFRASGDIVILDNRTDRTVPERLNDARVARVLPLISSSHAGVAAFGTDCEDVPDGYALVKPDAGEAFTVLCRSGWVVFQKRTSATSFQKTWSEYKAGWNESGNLWLGLDHMHRLTSSSGQMHVELKDAVGLVKTATYSTLSIGSEATFYTLNVAGHSGTLPDSLEYHNGQGFSTHDADHDSYGGGSCVHHYKGGWWYKACHHANLNGVYYTPGVTTSYADGICWYSWHGHHYSFKESYMMLRANVNRRRFEARTCKSGYLRNSIFCSDSATQVLCGAECVKEGS